LCQAALVTNVSRFIHTSTSEVYGTAQYVPIDEKHPLQAQSPYSASKIGADAMAMSYFNSFNMPLSIARPFNTYGPRQSARAVIPTIISQIAKGIKQIKLGDVSPTRDFNFVLDTCQGFLELAKCNKAVGEVVNIGSNFEISIGDTLNMIRELMHSDIEFITDSQRVRPEKSEVFRLWCDNTKLHALTGFRPQYSIREGLQITVDWFTRRENLAKYKADIYNV
jgi:nucleoside-diphosphate-sugar epimerase